MLKELNICGVFVSPFAGELLLAILLFIPLHRLFDRWAIQRWVWHRPLFDVSILVILLSLIGLMF